MRKNGTVNNITLEYALQYARLGWRVVPCHSVINGVCTCGRRHECPSPGKHPRIGKLWPQAASSDIEVVTSWYTLWPTANVGIATGGASQIVVCDIDSDKGGLETWKDLIRRHGEPPPTPTSETGGGGNHLFYVNNSGIPIANKVSVVPGIDIRGDGGLAIVPPSTHRNNTYAWVEDLAPWEVAAAPIPAWLLAMISSSNTYTRFDVERAISGVPEGERNDTIYRLACSLRTRDLPYKEAHAIVMAAAARCIPPLDEAEAADIIDRVYRTYPPGKSWNFTKIIHSVSESTEWPDPVDIEPTINEPFPVDMLPGWVRAYVQEVSRVTATPTDLSGLYALAALSASMGGKATIRLRGWYEPLNLYTVVCARPGSRKSAIFKYFTTPILDAERAMRDQYEAQIAKSKAHLDILNTEIKRIKTQLAGNVSSMRDSLMRDLEAKCVEVAQLERVCIKPDLVVNDITPESLVTHLYNQGGKIALLSADGDVFEMMQGRYQSNGGANIDVYIKGHAGDYIKVNRVSGREEVIYQPALTVGVFTQRRSLRGLLAKKTLLYRGLLARFLYAICPDDIQEISDRDISDVDINIARTYADNIHALLAVPTPLSQTDAPVLHLSDRALDLFYSFENAVLEELKQGCLRTPEELFEWGRKLAGAVGRIAGLLHCADTIMEGVPPWYWEVSESVMGMACAIGKYLVPHAALAFKLMYSTTSHDAAKTVIEHIRQERLVTINRQDIVRWSRRYGAGLNDIVTVLIDHGYIRRDSDGKGFNVNPKVLAKED